MSTNIGVSRLIESFKRLLHTVVAILHARLALIATELAQARAHVIGLLITSLLAVLCVGIALIMAVFFIVALFWDEHRFAAMGTLIVIFSGMGFVLWRVVAHKLKLAVKFFEATREEFSKDSESFRAP